MTQQINPAAEAAREEHRSKSTGRFEEHTHGLPGITLSGDVNTPVVRLGDYAEEQKNASLAALRASNKALIAIGARRVAEAMPDVSRVFMEQDDDSWFIRKGFTKDNRELTDVECDEVAELLGERPVTYDSRYEREGIDLEHMRQWLPEGTGPDTAHESPTQQAIRRASLALKAGDTDPPAYDPSVRLADALTDFRHFARENGLDMEQALTLSAEYFQNELDEDDLVREDTQP